MSRIKYTVAALFFAVVIVTAAAEPLIKPAMISISGGTFFMGSNEGSFKVTERVHEVTVRPFLLSETEITQELYAEVMNQNPSWFKGSRLPVETVSWLDAVLFCNALSLRFGLSPAYTVEGENVIWNRESKGYRLPTEAEWEYAGRGGIYGAVNSTPLEKAYFAGGDAAANPQDYCWFSLNGANTTHPVKSKLPNRLGLYDMSGNVWEWCWDRYADYPGEHVTDYTGSDTGKQRVYRGGAYLNNLNQLRTTFRIWDSPALKYRTLGFRIAQNS
jgi:formylglycine-generating enzyme required for sulfatase activity